MPTYDLMIFLSRNCTFPKYTESFHKQEENDVSDHHITFINSFNHHNFLAWLSY